jgi:hypothetical protein
MEAGEASLAMSSGPSPAERPSWLRMTVIAGLSVIVGGFAIVGVDLALALTRLDHDPDLLRSHVSMNGGWAWLSYALKTAFACWLLAWGTRRCVRDWTDDWAMRIWPVAVAVAIAVVSQNDEASVSLASCALVVVVARNVALVRRPATRWQPSRWQLAGAVIVLMVLAVAAFGYRPIHPLAAAFEDRRSDTSFSFGSDGEPSRPYTRLAFMLGNEGTARVTVRSVGAMGSGFMPGDIAVLTSRADAVDAHSCADLHRPVDTERIARGDQLHAWLEPSRAFCRGPHRTQGTEVWGIEVRYETLGFGGIQSLPIDPPAQLRCPARH